VRQKSLIIFYFRNVQRELESRAWFIRCEVQAQANQTGPSRATAGPKKQFSRGPRNLIPSETSYHLS